MNWSERVRRRAGARPAAGRRARPALEGLEQRLVLYSASGYAWPAPQLITLSFMPDGTSVGGHASDMQARLTAMFGSASAWQSTILKAAQTWATYANVNFELVPDSGAAQGSGSYQQGDPSFGDIRLGGYNFGSTTTLASAYMPPPANNYSIAGDIALNTGLAFRSGSTYDLFTVAAHEIGHALGLNHTTATSAAEEYATYSSVKNTFNADDIAGIRAIYGTRSADAYDANGSNDTLATADDVSSLVSDAALQGTITGLDITTTSDVDYYRFTAPAACSSTVNVTVSSNNISLLAPSIALYNASGTALASLTATGQYGTSQTLTWAGIQPGQTYFIKVDGADATAFGTGAYGLGLSLSGAPVGSIAGPVTQKPNGSPVQSGGGQALAVNSEALVNTFTSGLQAPSPNRGAVAISSQGNYVVTWASNGQDGSGYGVYAQLYNATGAKVGSEFRVNTTTAGDQTNPAVAVDALGDFVIAWQSANQDGGGWGVYAQMYSATGAKVGSEFRVNSTTANDQSNPSVAMNDGGFVVAWQSANQDGGGWGVYAQRYGPTGTPQGGEFRVNTTTANDQMNPSVACATSGAFAVAWQGQDASGSGIYAQLYDASGLPVGAEQQVNTYTSSDQTLPSVTMSSAGTWAVVWQSNLQDGAAWGVYAQRLDAFGNRVGGEFRVNTTTSGNQMSPAAAMDRAGDLLVTWVNNSATTWSIYGQQYAASGAALGGEFTVNTTKGYTVSNPSVAINDQGKVVAAWSGGNATDKDGVLLQQFALTSVQDSAPPPGVLARLLLRDLRAARRAHDAADMQSIRQQLAGLRAAQQAARRAHHAPAHAPATHQSPTPRAVDHLLARGSKVFAARHHGH